jgi:hypothetical protein
MRRRQQNAAFKDRIGKIQIQIMQRQYPFHTVCRGRQQQQSRPNGLYYTRLVVTTEPVLRKASPQAAERKWKWNIAWFDERAITDIQARRLR